MASRTELSRRAILGTGAALGVGAILGANGLLSAQPAAALDAFDELRLDWRDALTGGAVDPSDPRIAAAIGRLDTEVTALVGSIQRVAPFDRVYTDRPLGTNSRYMSESYQRLRVMAIGYATASSSFQGDAALLADIRDGLNRLYDLVYGPAHPEVGGWFHWKISSPQALNDACVLLYDQLTGTELAEYTAIVESRVPGAGNQVGANRVDYAQTMVVQGVLSKDTARVAAGRDALSGVFPIRTSGDGFYADGTFLQHGSIPYTGLYGRVLLEGLAELLALLGGSAWEVTDPNRQNIFDAVDKSFAPVLFDGRIMDATRGRGVTRWNQTEVSDGQVVLESILRLSTAAPAAQAAQWRALVKGWLQRSTSGSVFDNASVARSAAFLAVLDDAATPAAAEATGTTILPVGARAAHKRPGWAVTVASASHRIAHYEAINGENLQGWFQGSGMLYRYDADHAQYSDAFWAAVDPFRLPGTTVQRTTLSTAAGRPTPNNTWSGGAVFGNYGTTAQYLMPPGGVAMRAWKSWHFLSSMVICLGSKISSSASARVETTLENRNLHASGVATLTIDGAVHTAALGVEDVVPGASWAHLEGVGGYVLLGRADLHVLREDRSADWNGVNNLVEGAPAPSPRRFQTLWLDHGIAPSSAGYAYAILPGGSVTTTASTAAAPPVLVEALDDRHVVEVPAARYISANIFAPAGVTLTPTNLPDLEVPGATSLIVRKTGTQLSLAIAQPTRAVDAVAVTVLQGGLSVVQGDPTITISSAGGATTVTVDTSDRDGRTHQVVLG